MFEILGWGGNILGFFEVSLKWLHTGDLFEILNLREAQFFVGQRRHVSYHQISQSFREEHNMRVLQ